MDFFFLRGGQCCTVLIQMNTYSKQGSLACMYSSKADF